MTKYRSMSTTAYNTIRSDLTYYNNTLAGGKWQKMMDPYNNGNGQPVIEAMPSLPPYPPRLVPWASRAKVRRPAMKRRR